MRRLVIAAAILLIHGRPAEALLLWNWSYGGTGVSASGTFTTNDARDEAGFYQIVGITGADNGVTITGLQATGTAVPGNEPYAVDNLVSAAEPHFDEARFRLFAGERQLRQSVLQRLDLLRVSVGAALLKRRGPRKAGIVLGRHCAEPSAVSLLFLALVGLIGLARRSAAVTLTEPMREIPRSYNVGYSTISSLERDRSSTGSTAAHCLKTFALPKIGKGEGA